MSEAAANLIRTVAPQGSGSLSEFPASLFGNLLVGVVLSVFDHFVAKETRARWFALHAFGNLLVVLTAARSLVTCLGDPVQCADSRVYNDESLFGTASPWPVIITNTIHAYHLTFPLTADERFHHFMFIPTIGLMGQYFKWGALQGSLAFFISGLPGGIDYLMLVLTKHQMVPVMVQKRLCAALNVYLRGPGIVVVAFTLWMAFSYGRTTVPLPVGLVIGAMALFNSLYYTKQSVANYAIAHAVDILRSGAAKGPDSEGEGEPAPIPRELLRSSKLKEPQSTMS